MNKTTFAGLGLVDVIVAVVILLSIFGALRRGAGPLSALASGAVIAVVAWLVCWGIAVWGPASVADQIRDSRIVALAPFPSHATRQLDHLGGS